MKIVYIAHPIGGDVASNMKKVLDIVRKINLEEKDIMPFAPYIVDVLAMNDNNPEEREIGLRNCYTVFNSNFVDELWLYGPQLTAGMKAEVDLALDKLMPVYVKDPEMDLPFGYQFIKRDGDEDNKG
jgi:hypothetical protein